MLDFEQELEIICQQGCKYTNKIIKKLKNNKTPVELQHLSSEQLRIIHLELTKIMSVYD